MRFPTVGCQISSDEAPSALTLPPGDACFGAFHVDFHIIRGRQLPFPDHVIQANGSNCEAAIGGKVPHRMCRSGGKMRIPAAVRHRRLDHRNVLYVVDPQMLLKIAKIPRDRFEGEDLPPRNQAKPTLVAYRNRRWRQCQTLRCPRSPSFQTTSVCGIRSFPASSRGCSNRLSTSSPSVCP